MFCWQVPLYRPSMAIWFMVLWTCKVSIFYFDFLSDLKIKKDISHYDIIKTENLLMQSYYVIVSKVNFTTKYIYALKVNLQESLVLTLTLPLSTICNLSTVHFLHIGSVMPLSVPLSIVPLYNPLYYPFTVIWTPLHLINTHHSRWNPSLYIKLIPTVMLVGIPTLSLEPFHLVETICSLVGSHPSSCNMSSIWNQSL